MRLCALSHMATPLKQLGQSLRELDKCMAPIHSRSPGDESDSRQIQLDSHQRQPTEAPLVVAPAASAHLLLAAAVPCLRNGSGPEAGEGEDLPGLQAALDQIGRARAVLRRAAGWEAEASATAAQAAQAAVEPASAQAAAVAEWGVDVASTEAPPTGIASPRPPVGERRATGERARAAGERARAAAEEARSMRGLAEEAALSAAGWEAAAVQAEALAAEAAAEEEAVVVEEEAEATAAADAEARAAAEIAKVVALVRVRVRLGLV